jgi:hypothetical protein
MMVIDQVQQVLEQVAGNGYNGIKIPGTWSRRGIVIFPFEQQIGKELMRMKTK